LVILRGEKRAGCYHESLPSSVAENIRYGIAINCGVGFPVHNDSQIDSELATMKDYPRFYKAMQAEGREWVELFPRESINKEDDKEMQAQGE